MSHFDYWKLCPLDELDRAIATRQAAFKHRRVPVSEISTQRRYLQTLKSIAASRRAKGEK